MTVSPPQTPRPAVPTGPARLLIDVGAIRDNTAALLARAGGAEVMAVVKADAYGHGLLPSARAALAGGATWLGTATLREALALREAGLPGRVLSWLHGPGDAFGEAVAADVDLASSDPWSLAEIAAAARAQGRPARVHLKVDTGLGRNGARGEGFTALLARAAELRREGVLDVVGLMSHFAYADAPGHPTVRAQRDVFLAAADACERAGLELQVRHLANSAAVLLDPDSLFDLVRPGLALYGLSPVPDLVSAAEAGLRPAMTCVADLALVKDLPAGSGVSYAHTYTTPADTRVGVVPMGYADGVPRSASGAAPVLVGGRTLPIAGRVCMDQFVVDLGPGATDRVGEPVVLFGDPATGAPSAEQWAEAAGTIPYEIVTRMSTRLPRVLVGEEGM